VNRVVVILLKNIIQKNVTYRSYVLLVITFLSITGNPAFGERAPGDVQYERVGDVDPEKLKSFPPSIFPHWVHRIRYRCDACHDSLFEMKPGITPVTHEIMDKGEVCSACHDGKTAFDAGFKNCNRCHVVEAE